MKKYEPLRISKHRSLFIFSLLSLLLLVVVPVFSKQIYFVHFYKIYIDYNLKTRYEKRMIAERQESEYIVKSVRTDSLPKTIVLVIGESLTRTHMSLYGYARNTNPRLGQLNDSLSIYTDVISPQVHTIPVLRSVVTLADREHPEYMTEKPSLFELFDRAGFDTYFISNQPFSENSNRSYDAFFRLAKHKYDLSSEKQTDGIILSTLDRILKSDTANNKLIVIHLIGNHMAYEFRYTPMFNVFDYKEDGFIHETKYRNTKACRTIDRYDNSVLYNDFVIATIIKMLDKNKNTNSGLIYFSDHGEEVYDFRNFAGHAYEKVTSYMCEVPFLVWMSDRYKKNRADLVIDTHRPYSTEDFLYSLSDFADIRYLDYDDTKSIFSKQFKPKDRYIGNLTYEEVLDKSK